MRSLILALIAVLISGCMSEAGYLPSPGQRGVQLASAGIGLSPAAPLVSPHLLDDRIVARDGAVLPLRRWLPAGTPKAVVLALHGFNDYSHAFAGVGPALAKRGMAVYAYDQRGFGRAPDRGRWAGERHLVDDASTAAALLRQHYPGVPFYLMGESMGGAVAILAATGSDGVPAVSADGVILVAPAVWGRQTMNIFERIGLWMADLFPAVRLSPDALPITIRPSDNLPMLRALSADPLVIKDTRADTLNGLVDLLSNALVAGRRLDAPAIILYGAQDQIVPQGPVAHFVASLPGDALTRQRVAFYRNGYHMLLRDLEGPRLITDIAHWIAHPHEPLPSGADRGARAQLLGRSAATTQS
jgi:alpha-beta hydrolase superfamily lysophospholipase